MRIISKFKDYYDSVQGIDGGGQIGCRCKLSCGTVGTIVKIGDYNDYLQATETLKDDWDNKPQEQLYDKCYPKWREGYFIIVSVGDEYIIAPLCDVIGVERLVT